MAPLAKYVYRCLVLRPFLSSLVLCCMFVVGATLGGVVATGQGLRKAFQSMGHDSWVLVTNRGSETEVDSTLPISLIGSLTAHPEVKRYSPENLFLTSLPTDEDVDVVTTRAVEPQGFEMHDIKIVEGRLPRLGAMEVIIGDALHRRKPHMGIGATLNLSNGKFTTVGVFHSAGYMSGEIWTSRAAFRSDPRRGATLVSVVYIETGSAAEAAALAARLSGTRAFDVVAELENDFYTRLRKGFAQIGEVLLVIFALVVTGAMLAAASLLSLMQQPRLPEMCTLRAVGFRDLRIALLILCETLLMILAGGTLGILAAAAMLRNYVAHAVGPNVSSLNFSASLDLRLIALSIGVLLVVGLAAAVVPIVRMKLTPITRGLREL